MLSASLRVSSLLAALLVATAAGCGAEGDGEGQADADVEPACGTPGEAEESFPLELADQNETDFVALHDGDSVTLVKGPQGAYMILLDVRASLGLSADSVCFECSSQVASTTGLFEHEMPSGAKTFDQVAGDIFESGDFIVLGGDPSMYDGADATVAMACAGHGLSGSVSRTVHLLAPVE